MFFAAAKSSLVHGERGRDVLFAAAQHFGRLAGERRDRAAGDGESGGLAVLTGRFSRSPTVSMLLQVATCFVRLPSLVELNGENKIVR